MIHSLAGGKISPLQVNDFAKVKIDSGAFAGGIYWYICTGMQLSAGDKVLVPLGRENSLISATVQRVDTNIFGDRAPVPLGRAKRVAKKI